MSMTPPDLSTTYLGLRLPTPLIPSASPLSASLANLEEMKRCGAGAVVFPTLFEETLDGHPVSREDGLERIREAKARLGIPVIASLSANRLQAWSEMARELEAAGADALELNIYEARLSTTVPSAVIESHYLEAVERVVAAVRIPVSVKLAPFFTNLAWMTKEMEEIGAKGFVLFNRFYLPDIDLRAMAPGHSLKLSTSAENRLSLRWISLLYRPIQADLVASTGVRTGEDVLKMVLAGAAATQLCGILLHRGISWLEIILGELRAAMTQAGLRSIGDARGALAQPYTERPGAIERKEYQSALRGYERFEASQAPVTVGATEPAC